VDKDQVPQHDAGLLGGVREVQYAVDEHGRYVQVRSTGWDPKNAALLQAHEMVRARVEDARRRALAGESSPLEFHMERRMMDPGLLADYAGLSARTVKRHLTPRGFAAVSADDLARYARALDVDVEELRQVPAGP
jgi:hypothetical protein